MHLKIRLNNVAKKFGTEWIFKGVDLTINQSDKIVLLGGNGSGKSTLLQVISGYVLPNKGTVDFFADDQQVDKEFYRNHMSFASPYFELIDEFTFEELIEHTRIYKPFLNNLSANDIIEIAELTHAKDKPLKNYSSGMKQRVKLSMAILADCPLLLLDEPASNLDRGAIDWYKKAIGWYSSHKTIIICSNSIAEEFELCDKEIDLNNYK